MPLYTVPDEPDPRRSQKSKSPKSISTNAMVYGAYRGAGHLPCGGKLRLRGEGSVPCDET